MKTLASLLGALTLAAMVAGCGPDMKTINAAGDKAEADATRLRHRPRQRNSRRARLMRPRSRPRKRLRVQKMRYAGPMTRSRVWKQPFRPRLRSRLSQPV